MPNGVDKSLLDRLAALRGPSASSSSPSDIVSSANIDPIERKKTPTREEALADRLKRLREGSASPAASPHSPSFGSRPSKVKAEGPPDTATKGTRLEDERHARDEEGNEKSLRSMKDALREEATESAPLSSAAAPDTSKEAFEEEYDYFQTDDAELEELLKDVGRDDPPPAYSEPTDQEVKDFLEQLSASVPQDDAPRGEPAKSSDVRRELNHHEEKDDSDDSDGDKMKDKVDDVIARYRDEMELEKNAPDHRPAEESSGEEEEDGDSEEIGTDQADNKQPVIDLPDVPATPGAEPHPKPTDSSSLDSLTSRLSALRNNHSIASNDDVLLPSVPSNAPTKEPTRRLTSRTNYTDADMDKWCTVCLEDATLQCLGCDDDPYCARCWREMHVGESAGYEERGHKAVEFGKRKKKKKVALGA